MLEKARITPHAPANAANITNLPLSDYCCVLARRNVSIDLPAGVVALGFQLAVPGHPDIDDDCECNAEDNHHRIDKS